MKMIIGYKTNKKSQIRIQVISSRISTEGTISRCRFARPPWSWCNRENVLL